MFKKGGNWLFLCTKLALLIDTFNRSFNLFIRLFLKLYLMTGIKKWVKLSFRFLKAIFIMLKME